MEKGFQLTSKLHKRSVGRNILFVDRISELPDDILVTILSHLTMKEAARTTILSRRYKNLWAHTTGSLDFDGSKILWTIKFYWNTGLIMQPNPECERPAFISWVNQILNSHKGATVDEFRVHFDLDSSSRLYIDSWIDFALQKRAHRLELDLERISGISEDIYPFPASLVGHPTINSLTYVKLNYVGVTRELLESLLSNCPFLEFLSVKNSQSLVGLKVFAAPPRLKYLKISCCLSVEFLEISSAINLTTLRYAGLIARVCFKNAPNLADVSFGGPYGGFIVKGFHGHSIPPSQIEKLKLDLSFSMFDSFDEFPELVNLKELELTVMATEQSLLSYASLLEKFPMLYRLYMEFHWFEEPEEIEIKEKKCRGLQNLKLVELCAFRGGISDVELATYLVTNSPALEKITIDTRPVPFFVGTILEATMLENHYAKECARQLLSTKLLPGVEFLVL